jgi:hypothetical protein
MLKPFYISLLCILTLLTASCGSRDENGKKRKNDFSSITVRIARKSSIEEYPKVPGEDILRGQSSNLLYGELQSRYAQQLTALKVAVDADHAKLMVVVMSPEVGKFASYANTYGIPYIVQICANQGIDCIDITPDISEWTSVNDPNRAPVGGGWSKASATFCAQMLAGVLVKYDDYHNASSFPAAERPETFGDLTPESEQVDDVDTKKPLAEGEHGNTKFTVNKQGLRMFHSVTFPKTRQRILFLGDSRILNPFIDDDHTITQQLQMRYPDKEMLNAGHSSYTMEDYLSLYREKARYAEPDIVIVCTNGGDILDEYFSQRNRYSRDEKVYRPTEQERRYYYQSSGGN